MTSKDFQHIKKAGHGVSYILSKPANPNLTNFFVLTGAISLMFWQEAEATHTWTQHWVFVPTRNKDTHTKEGMWVPGEPGLQSESHDSQSYKERPYLETNNKQT